MLNVDSRPGANGRHPIFDHGIEGYSARWVDDEGAMRYSNTFDSQDELEDWFYSLNRQQLNTVGATRTSPQEKQLITVGQRWKATAENTDEWRSLNTTYLRFVAPMIAGMVADTITPTDVSIMAETIEDAAGLREANKARRIMSLIRTVTSPVAPEQQDVVAKKKTTYMPSSRRKGTKTWKSVVRKTEQLSKPLAQHSRVYREVMRRYATLLRNRPLAQKNQKEIQPINFYTVVDPGSIVEHWAAWHYSKTLRQSLGLPHATWENYVIKHRIGGRGTLMSAFFKAAESRMLSPEKMLTWLHTWETTPLALEGHRSTIPALYAVLQHPQPRVLIPPADGAVYQEIIRLIALKNNFNPATLSATKETRVAGKGYATPQTQGGPATPKVSSPTTVKKEPQKMANSITYNEAFARVLESKGYSASTKARLNRIWKNHVEDTALGKEWLVPATFFSHLTFWAGIFSSQEIAESNVRKLNGILKSIIDEEGSSDEDSHSLVPDNATVMSIRDKIAAGEDPHDVTAEILQRVHLGVFPGEEDSEQDIPDVVGDTTTAATPAVDDATTGESAVAPEDGNEVPSSNEDSSEHEVAVAEDETPKVEDTADVGQSEDETAEIDAADAGDAEPEEVEESDSEDTPEVEAPQEEVSTVEDGATPGKLDTVADALRSLADALEALGRQ